jgi:mono/diheme cytochrome c family protein
LNSTTTAATFGSISPPAGFAPNSPEQEGFTIAKQNCLRCHNQGQYGGKQSGPDWTMLSVWADKQPTYFASYIKNPQAFNANARIPGNPQYDTATLNAITAYFKSVVTRFGALTVNKW